MDSGLALLLLIPAAIIVGWIVDEIYEVYDDHHYY